MREGISLRLCEDKESTVITYRISICELSQFITSSMVLTVNSAHAPIHSTSRPDWSDKNGLATGRKSRRKAVFAFLGA